MRQILIIIITWLLTFATAQAQSGLNVAPLFEGKIIPQQRMVETRVRGKMLSKYQLNYFRSVRFKADNKQEINRVHNLIEQKHFPALPILRITRVRRAGLKKPSCSNCQRQVRRTVFCAISATTRRLRLSTWKAPSIPFIHYEN